MIVILIAFCVVLLYGALAIVDARERKRERLDPLDEPYNESDTLP